MNEMLKSTQQMHDGPLHRQLRFGSPALDEEADEDDEEDNDDGDAAFDGLNGIEMLLMSAASASRPTTDRSAEVVIASEVSDFIPNSVIVRTH